MITIKNAYAIEKMAIAGKLLNKLFSELEKYLASDLNISTGDIDEYIGQYLDKHNLISSTRGYMGYKHVSCISVNDEVVHGIPDKTRKLKSGDLVKIDICASYNGYCADMARCFFMGPGSLEAQKLVSIAQMALDKGIAQARPNNRISDISAAIEAEVKRHGYGIVEEFAGHGIGKKMHEDPEILNYGKPGCGPIIKPGMAFAIEPMITMGSNKIYIAKDNWTVKTQDKSLAAHVEDTIIVTQQGPQIITRVV